MRPLLVLAALLCALPSALHADDDDDALDHELARQAVLEGRILSLEEITRRFQEQMKGEIVGVDLSREDDGSFKYEFKLLSPEGRLVEAEVDAATAAILEVEDEQD